MPSKKIKLPMWILWKRLLSLCRQWPEKTCNTKAPTFQGSGNFIDSDKVPTADIKLEPLFLRGFFEKIGSRWILLWVALRQGPIKVWNLVRTATALISPCFQKAWTGIKGIRITADFSNRLRKLVYYNSSIWRRYGPSPITSTYHHFFYALQKTSNAPGKKFPNSNDFHAGFNIVIYYSPVHAPCLPPLCIHFFTNTRQVTPHLCDYFALHTLFFWYLLPISFCLYSFWC